jgi:hypothetical protein
VWHLGGATTWGSCTPWPIFELDSANDRSFQRLESLKVRKKIDCVFFFFLTELVSVEVVDP